MSATITRINGLDLVGRLAINPNGAEFRIVGLEFDANMAAVVIELQPYDEDGELIENSTVGMLTLTGWTIQ